MTNTKLSPNWVTILGGLLALVLAIGYVVFVALNRSVPSTYTIVLVAAVTHFLGVVLPANALSSAETQLETVLDKVLAIFTSTSTSVTTTTPSTTVTTKTPASVSSPPDPPPGHVTVITPGPTEQAAP